MSATPNSTQVLDQIKIFIETHAIRIEVSDQLEHIAIGLTPVFFQFNRTTYVIHIHDEYNDLSINNQSLHCVLVLRELALIQDAIDFLQWCTFNSIDPNNSDLQLYFRKLSTSLPNIEKYFPDQEIDCFVTDLDFQLNAGAMPALRTNEVI